MSGGELDTGRLLDGPGVGGGPPMTIDGAEAGAPALDDALVSVGAFLADSLESAVQDKIANIAIRPTAAINNTLTPHLVNFF